MFSLQTQLYCILYSICCQTFPRTPLLHQSYRYRVSLISTIDIRTSALMAHKNTITCPPSSQFLGLQSQNWLWCGVVVKQSYGSKRVLHHHHHAHRPLSQRYKVNTNKSTVSKRTVYKSMQATTIGNIILLLQYIISYSCL